MQVRGLLEKTRLELASARADAAANEMSAAAERTQAELRSAAAASSPPKGRVAAAEVALAETREQLDEARRRPAGGM